jgi:hypothetical protein
MLAVAGYFFISSKPSLSCYEVKLRNLSGQLLRFSVNDGDFSMTRTFLTIKPKGPILPGCRPTLPVRLQIVHADFRKGATFTSICLPAQVCCLKESVTRNENWLQQAESPARRLRKQLLTF